MVESRNKKDLSLFDSNQIIELLKKINSKSRKFLRATCVFFSDYYNWCVSENLVPANNLGNPYDVSRVKGIIDVIIPKEVLENKFFTKDEFLKYVDNIYDPSNKLIAYCLYLGIRGQENEEIRKLKSSDLNEKRSAVRLFDERIVKVDDTFINLFKETVNAEHYYPDNRDYANKLSLYTYSTSDYVFRPCLRGDETYTNEPMPLQTFLTRLTLIKKQSGNLYLTGNVIYRNGLINYIKERYAEKDVSLKDALFYKVDKHPYFYESETQQYIDEFGSNITARMLRSEIKDYLDCL
jgi:hypothetical protein